MTEFLAEKINVLKNIIQSQKLERYQRELMLEDISETTGNEAADNALQAQAEEAKALIALFTRRIAVRIKRLDALLSEQKADNERVEKETAEKVASEPKMPKDTNV